MPSSHWLTHAFVLLLVACNGAALPTPSATPPLVRTDTPRPSSTLTSTSTPTPTQTAPPSPTVEDFRRPADPQHALLLAVNAELEQSIFFVELEADLVRHLYTLPSNISLHGESGNASGASLPRGLPEGLMFLSPDGSTLVTLQPAFGGLPNFLHQIDLLTGDVTSLVLLQNYQLTLPSGPYRSLELISPDGNLQNATVASMFYGLAWAPDSQGFGFILGTLMDFGVLPQQLYHVAKGSTRAAALASSVPGRTSGYRGEWSPDGRYIFFASNRTGSNQVWRMNSDGSNQIQITKREGGYPRFVTPDGKWVYFESGLHQKLWRVSSDGGEEIQVSEGTAYSPAFSADGKFVAYFFWTKESGRPNIAVMAVDSRKLLKTFALIGEKVDPVKIAWESGNRTLNYITAIGLQNSLWRQSLDSDKPRLIADLGNEDIEDFALSPDGSFAFIRGKWIHDAVLIEGLK